MQVAKHAVFVGISFGLLMGAAENASSQNRATPPQPTAQPQPPLPMNRAGLPVEGWAVVRYSVLADGTPDNVRVLDTAPSDIEPGPIADGVRRWRFSPAKDGNEAVDWHNMESLVAFRSEEPVAAASDDFTTKYQAIRAILEAQPPVDFAAALAMNEALLEESAMRAREIGLALAQRALIALGMEDWHRAYDDIRLVTDPRVSALPGEDLFVGLQLRIQLANELGRPRDALETHARIAEGLEPDQEDPFAPVAQILRDKLANEETLQAAGHIDDEPWRIAPGRRIFTIANVEGGAVENIDVECDRRRLTLDFQTDVEWQLPAGWGNCTLLVNGTPGTNFLFFEFLEAAAAAE